MIFVVDKSYQRIGKERIGNQVIRKWNQI